MADDQIEIEIVLDDGSIAKGFSKIQKEGNKTSQSLTNAFAGVATAVAAAFAGRKIIAAAAAQEAAVQELNTSLKLAGSFSQEASQSFQDFASSLQQSTRFGDEVILQQLALARNFSRSNEEAQKLVTAAVDLSEATGITLDSAVRNLGKTFGGLTGELGESVPALRNLTAEQLKSGEALNFVIERFGGAAAANVQTFSGRVEQLANVFGDLLESLGSFVTKSPALIAAFGQVAEEIANVSGSLNDLGKGSTDFFRPILTGLITLSAGINSLFVAPLEVATKTVIVVFKQIEGTIRLLAGTAASTASRLISIFSEDSELAQALKGFASDQERAYTGIQDAAKDTFANITQLPVADTIADILGRVQGAVDQSGNPFSSLADKFDETSNKIKDSSKKIVKTFDLKTGVGAGIAKAIQATVQAAQAGQNAFAAFAKSVLSVFGDLAIQLGQFFIIQGIAVEALKSISGAAAVAAGAALIALGTLIKGATGGEGGLSAGGPGALGGDAGAVGGIGLVGEGIDEAEETEGPGQNLVVNVEGTVLDPQGVGLQIAEVLNEAGFGSGAVIA